MATPLRLAGAHVLCSGCVLAAVENDSEESSVKAWLVDELWFAWQGKEHGHLQCSRAQGHLEHLLVFV